MTNRERFELWTRTKAPRLPAGINPHDTYEFYACLWAAWQAGQEHLRDELLTALIEESQDYTGLWNRCMQLHDNTAQG